MFGVASAPAIWQREIEKILIGTDASPYAVGAVISHIFPDGTERPIQFISQTLTATQQKYAQIDKEAYAIVFAVKKFYQYLYGRRFTLYTDHQPLVRIFAPDKSIPLLSASRMQHYALFLQAFTYDIHYKNTKCHGNADALSRLPIKSEDTHLFEACDIFELQQIETLPITVNDIAHQTISDKTLQPLLKALRSGKLLRKQYSFGIDQTEFSLQSNCIMRGIRVVIPKIFRKTILEELHTAHFGVNKMKSLARSYCWWPGIDLDIVEVAKSCLECNKIMNNPSKVPVHQWEEPAEPFERIHIDYAGPVNNMYYLVIVDAFTKWPEVFPMKQITTNKTITILRSLFARFGICSTLVSDNGTQFTALDFSLFLKQNGIKHKRTAPYHPATNGLAERYVQTLKQSLKALQSERNSIDLELAKLLLQYRKMPHSILNASPSFLMFGREIRSKLDLIKPKEIVRTDIQKPNIRELAEGQRVGARNYLGKDKWRFGQIKKKLVYFTMKLS
eukprot:XP_008187120.1 PREDICTED: uncharacterized protein K02A2.6-like [Acyrthosiphon pisum]